MEVVEWELHEMKGWPAAGELGACNCSVANRVVIVGFGGASRGCGCNRLAGVVVEVVVDVEVNGIVGVADEDDLQNSVWNLLWVTCDAQDSSYVHRSLVSMI